MLPRYLADIISSINKAAETSTSATAAKTAENVDYGSLITGSTEKILPDFDPVETAYEAINILSTEIIDMVGAFPSLTEVTQKIFIASNLDLKKVEGFGSLMSSGYLYINDNPRLTSIGGFRQLVNATSNIYITNNHQLLNVNGFNAVERITGKFYTYNNFNLQNFTGFNRLVSVGENFEFTQNGNRAYKSLEVSPFDRLERINDYISIRDMGDTKLTKEHFPSLKCVKRVSDHNNGMDASLLNFVKSKENSEGCPEV